MVNLNLVMGTGGRLLEGALHGHLAGETANVALDDAQVLHDVFFRLLRFALHLRLINYS